MEKHVPDFKRILFCILIGGCAAIGMLFLPALMLLPALLAFVTLAWGALYAAVAYILSAGAVIVLSGGTAGALYALAVYLPAAVLLSIMLQRKAPHRLSVGAVSAALALGVYAVMCLPSLIAGNGPFDLVIQYVDLLMDNARTLADSAGLPAADAVIVYLQTLRAYVPEIVTIMLTCGGMLMGFIDHITARAMLKRAGYPVRDMAPFRLWGVSRSFTWGALILLLGSALMSMIGMLNAEAISMAAQTIVLAPFALCGAATCEFVISLRPNRVLLRVILCAALAFTAPYCVFGLSMLGLFDRMFKFRQRRTGGS